MSQKSVAKAGSALGGLAGNERRKPNWDGQFCFGMLSNALVPGIKAKVLRMKHGRVEHPVPVWVIVLH